MSETPCRYASHLTDGILAAANGQASDPPNYELLSRSAAKAAANALRPALKLCKVAEHAGRDQDRHRAVPHTTPGHAVAQNAAIHAAEAVRIFDWIAAGCPKPGEK